MTNDEEIEKATADELRVINEILSRSSVHDRARAVKALRDYVDGLMTEMTEIRARNDREIADAIAKGPGVHRLSDGVLTVI